ncbi:MAG TPA: hypothetical protein VMH28_15990 [Candidatus Acidoferrales bacterium]|nr:hypothetical protein [Candidatus Acidoferrales bacterium]
MPTQPKTYITQYLEIERAAENPQDVLDIPSIGCRVALADLYEKVDLEAAG